MFDVIIVLGMHRSGTSAVSGVLSMLGGTLPKNLLVANAGNPKGYFESAPILQFHDELLVSAGSYWHDWRKFDSNWYGSPAGKSFRARALELFAAEFDHAKLPVLKDPRICRFAPFWISALKELGATPRFVIPIRSPLEVAQSLNKRDGTSITKGLLMWLRHVLDAEFQSRGEARSMFTWTQFNSNWRSIAKKISDDTGIVWPKLSKQTARNIDEFLSEDLIRNRVDDVELATHPDLHEWTNAAYGALLELTRNPRLKSAPKILDQVRDRFEQASSLFGRVLHDLEVELGQLQTQASSLKQENDQISRQLRALEARNTEVAATLQKTESELRNVINTHEKTESELRNVINTHEKTESELRNVINTHTARIRSLETTLGRTKKDNDRLVAHSDRISSEIQQLQIASARRVATMEETHAYTLTKTQERYEMNIRALRAQLVDAEAAAARWVAIYENKNGWSAIQPKKYQLRKLERELTRSGLFDVEWYMTEYKDVAENGLTPARHYLEIGYCRGYQPNQYFDTRWYLESYEDVRRSGMNPLLHYARHGYREGRDPGPEFQTDFYLASNPDVRLSGVNPLTHYLLHGRAEGRSPVKP